MRSPSTRSRHCADESAAAFAFGGENGHLLVDLRQLNNVTVDPSTNVATVGAGNLLGDTAIALNSQGSRALPHGTCPYVGIGGHAAYGGSVHLSALAIGEN